MSSFHAKKCNHVDEAMSKGYRRSVRFCGGPSALCLAQSLTFTFKDDIVSE